MTCLKQSTRLVMRKFGNRLGSRPPCLLNFQKNVPKNSVADLGNGQKPNQLDSQLRSIHNWQHFDVAVLAERITEGWRGCRKGWISCPANYRSKASRTSISWSLRVAQSLFYLILDSVHSFMRILTHLCRALSVMLAVRKRWKVSLISVDWRRIQYVPTSLRFLS